MTEIKVKKQSKSVGILYSVLSATCFGLASVFGKMSYSGGNTAISLTFYRAIVTVILLFGILKFSHISLGVSKNQIHKILVLGIFGQTLTTVFLNMAYFYIPAGTAVTLHFIYPAIVTIVCIIFFREKFSVWKICILIIIFIGISFFFQGLNASGTIGIILALLSSATWAFYIIFMERSKLSNMNPLLLTFYQCIILGCACFLWGSVSGEVRYVLTAEGWITTLLSALLFSIALIALQSGVKNAGPTIASTLGVFEPISSVIFGFVILSEEVYPKQLIGSCIVIVMIAVLILASRNESEEISKE